MNKLIETTLMNLFINNKDKNLVFSPASYLSALYSLSLCLKDKNLEELLDVLNISSDDLKYTILELKKSFQSLENYDCFLSSKEYIPALNKEVLLDLLDLKSDFKSFYDAKEAIIEVNKIVDEKTHGKIQNLANEQSVNELTKFIILNCVYFKKDWLHEFKEQDFKTPFHGSLKKTEIKYLYDTLYLPYYEDDGFDIVEIPYKDSQMCCYLFVPTTQSLFTIMNNFTVNFEKIKMVKEQLQVIITIPPFKIESEFELVESAEVAGLNNIFNWNKDWKLVNFDLLLPETVLKVQAIVQKAFIDVNKRGTEAAAATAILCGLSGCCSYFDTPKYKYITANKPFIYCLADKNHKDIPLFWGVVNNL